MLNIEYARTDFRRLRFGVSLALMFLVVACNNEEAIPDSQSVNANLNGEWILTRSNGGFVGEVNYTEEDSPESITFDGDTYVRSRTFGQQTTGTYNVQNVTSSNDRVFFDFGDDPESIFFGQEMQLIQSQFLETTQLNIYYSTRYEKR